MVILNLSWTVGRFYTNRGRSSNLHLCGASLTFLLLSARMCFSAYSLTSRQKNIYEWQIKNYEKLLADLLAALSLPATDMDHLKTKHLYTLIENNVCPTITFLTQTADQKNRRSRRSLGFVLGKSHRQD